MRSVVATSRRANPMRSGSEVSSRLGRGAFHEYGRELPRQVHGVADARVHPLPVYRTVNVRGISEDKRASLSEGRRDAVVHVIRRKPVHLRNVESEAIDGTTTHIVGTTAHIVEGQLAASPVRRFAQGPDEAHAPFSLQGNDQDEI